MGFLWLLAAIGTILTLERLLFFRRYNIDITIFFEGIRNLLSSGKVAEAIDLCEQEGSPAASIIRTALMDRELPGSELKARIKASALLEIPRCERRVLPILTIAKIAPLVGMISIVLSFYTAFKTLQTSGLTYTNSDVFADTVTSGMLLIITSLAISAFANIAYTFLYGKVQAIIYQLEWTYNECLQLVFVGKK